MRCLMEKFPYLNQLSWEDNILDVLVSLCEQRRGDEWREILEKYEWLNEWYLRVSRVDRMDRNGYEQISYTYSLAPKHPCVLWEMVIHNAQLMEAVIEISRIEKRGRRISLTRDMLRQPWFRCACLYSRYGICEFYRGKYYRLTRAFTMYLKNHGITLPGATA